MGICLSDPLDTNRKNQLEQLKNGWRPGTCWQDSEQYSWALEKLKKSTPSWNAGAQELFRKAKKFLCWEGSETLSESTVRGTEQEKQTPKKGQECMLSPHTPEKTRRTGRKRPHLWHPRCGSCLRLRLNPDREHLPPTGKQASNNSGKVTLFTGQWMV